MAICCAGKKQRGSHPVTGSIKRRKSAERNHQNHLKTNQFFPVVRQRSHSHFNNTNRYLMSENPLNSSSNSSLNLTNGKSSTSISTNGKLNFQRENNKKNNSTNNFNNDEDQLDSSSTKICSVFDRSSKAQSKTSIVHAEMIFYCFEILGNHLFNGRNHLGKYSSYASTNGHSNSSITTPSVLPNEPYPLFVTWLIGSEQKLRGCIGTFTPMNLEQGLREYAITSATNDSRFSPISRDEYPLLSCAVSILTDFESCSSFYDWDIGLHGIRIEFLNERGSKRSATYLPEVAHEQGWNHVQTLDSLMRKAGFKATITSELRKSVQVTRYRSEKLTLNYNDYIQSKSNGFSSNNSTTTKLNRHLF